MAIASSMEEVPVPPDLAFIGEIGLGGELRPVPHMQQRLSAAAQLGFRRCVVPVTRSGAKSSARQLGGNVVGAEDAAAPPTPAATAAIKPVPVRTVQEALRVAFGQRPSRS